jgi:L-galactose dehydrogenase
VEESLRRLRTGHVDLLQAHDVEFGDVEQIIHETIPTLRRLQEEGKARYIGISGYSLRTLMRIAGAAPVDSVLSYCRSNLLSDDMDRVLLPFAQKHGIGLINASALHMGVLTEQGAPKWHPAPKEVHEAGRRAADLCRRHGVELSAVALRFCLDHSPAASTLVGMATADEVRRNLRAWANPVDAELLQQVRAILAPVFNWVWPCGRPENQDPAHARKQ